MLLTLDVGNSQIYGGVFDGETLKLKFRKTSKTDVTSDELGVFLRSVIRENGGDPGSVEQIAICCVVPEIIYSLRSCCRKYFGVDPLVVLVLDRAGCDRRGPVGVPLRPSAAIDASDAPAPDSPPWPARVSVVGVGNVGASRISYTDPHGARRQCPPRRSTTREQDRRSWPQGSHPSGSPTSTVRPLPIA